MRKCDIPPLALAGLGPTFPCMLAGNTVELEILVEWLSGQRCLWHVTSILCILTWQPYPGMLQVSYAYLTVLHFSYSALEPTLVYNSSFSN